MNLITDIRQTLNEANAVLWHSTPAVLKIIKDDSFQLTFAGGTLADNRTPKHQFYLSCSRIPHGGYSHSEYYKNFNAKFQLDGQKLAHRFKIVPIRYWGDMGRDDRTRDENEDRIVSQNHEIRPASKYTTAIHIFVPDEKALQDREQQRKHLLEIASLDSAFRILWYTNQTAYQLADVRRATTECPVHGPDEYHEPYDGSAWKAKEVARLSNLLDWIETGKSEDPDVKDRMRYHDAWRGVEADVHNARPMKDPDTQKQLQRLARVMRKNNLHKVKDLVELAQNKWFDQH